MGIYIKINGLWKTLKHLYVVTESYKTVSMGYIKCNDVWKLMYNRNAFVLLSITVASISLPEPSDVKRIIDEPPVILTLTVLDPTVVPG